MSINIVLADDQALVRAGFRKILEADPALAVVAEAPDGLAAVQATREHGPNVVLMDIRMPNLDGIQATKRILESESATTRVLILTTFGLNEYVFEALRAGASGFLLKDAPPENLLAAVHVIARGDALLDPAITRTVVEEFARRPVRAEPGAELEHLTTRELEVLKILARGHSNADIAEKLVVSEGTVKTHVANVLRKLGVKDRVHAVIYAYESQLIEPGVTGNEALDA